MDFEPTAEQRAILAAAEQLLALHAGAARAILLAQKGDYDTPLEAALEEAGFADAAQSEGTGPLEAALLVEAIAKAGGTIACGAALLAAPCVARRRLPAPIALVTPTDSGPVRFGAHARTLLVADGDEARVVFLAPGQAEPVRSNFGFPLGRVRAEQRRGGESLGPGSGERLRAWWRVALACECVGAMSAALEVTVAYLSARKQFGRPIGSFQAVQHRLAECAVRLEGSRWLAYEAAAQGAPAELAAAAAAYATAAAKSVFGETHQLSGAIGYTHEHDLHVFSMRLEALRLELGGVAAHRRALAEARWVTGR
jgi:alkylation response protein AidB-like acyl-CoA dehydrogenase